MRIGFRLLIAFCVVLLASKAFAVTSAGFEPWVGPHPQAVGTVAPGLEFGTPGGGHGLSWMTALAPEGTEISYVLLQGTGGYYMIDEISTDAVVPEPSCLAALAIGVVGLAGYVRRRRSG